MSISLRTPNTTSNLAPLYSRLSHDVRALRVFSCCIVVIVAVSIYDSYLVSLYRNTILLFERNPVCEYLIRQDPGQLSWFMGGKLLGNLVVLGTLFGLFMSGYRHALTVAKSVACFQLLLLVYLLFSDEKAGVLSFDGLFSSNSERYFVSLRSAIAHVSVIVPTLALGVFVKRKWTATRAA